MEVIIKVARDSDPGLVAGAIAGVIREGKRPQARALGPSAVNQALKAVIMAHHYLAADGVDVICIPEFSDIEIRGLKRTAVTLTVEPRDTNHGS
jgi:stage V sporulation protein S